jgi:hypothetical protein
VLADLVRSRLIALLFLASVVACTRPPKVAAPPAPAATHEVREATLQNGFLGVRVELPPAPAGAKPAVIALAGEREALLAAGVVVVTYRVNWEVLKGLALEPGLRAGPATARAPRGRGG